MKVLRAYVATSECGYEPFSVMTGLSHLIGQALKESDLYIYCLWFSNILILKVFNI